MDGAKSYTTETSLEFERGNLRQVTRFVFKPSETTLGTTLEISLVSLGCNIVFQANVGTGPFFSTIECLYLEQHTQTTVVLFLI